MKSVGEVMAIGRTFAESLQKALRALETGLTGLNEIKIPNSHFSEKNTAYDLESVSAALGHPTPERILVIAQAIRLGVELKEIQRLTHYDPWFLEQLECLIEVENKIRSSGLPKDHDRLLFIKQMGFSDARLGELSNQSESQVTTLRNALGVKPVYKRIDTCAAEFPSQTPYMYSTYEGYLGQPGECESHPSDKSKVIVLGGGPNRIGQGIEFDYCCVHAVFALNEAGYETIMINCNPETVSTDYDTSDRLYFEPLTIEDVTEICQLEQKSGDLKGVIVQFGGQTPLKLANALHNCGINILGTSPDAIDLAEDRKRFQQILKKLNLNQPQNGLATSVDEAISVAEKLSFPLLIRPSYVLGGRAMEIVYDMEGVVRYITEAVMVSGDSPVLLDSFLQEAIEVDVDALVDSRGDIYIAGVMEHIEEAGIHSGDSACSLPPFTLSSLVLDEIERQTKVLAKALKVVGLMNIQFAVKDDDIYIIEVNPRASRTVPFVAKATGVPLAKIAARLTVNELLSDFGLGESGVSKATKSSHLAIKEAVFPFARFPGVDTILGPEMKSTGEVMGLDKDFGHAFAKSQLASGLKIPISGNVFISVRDRDKPNALVLAKSLTELGFNIVATRGTAKALEKNDIPVKIVNKVLEGRPHIVDSMTNEEIDLVINTTEGNQSKADSYSLRRTALTKNIPYYTTIAGANAILLAIRSMISGGLEVTPLQAYFSSGN